MYPVKLGYKGAIGRVRGLLANGHQAEALVTAAFTVEKTFRRTLRQLVVSAGFPSRAADRIITQYRGLEALKNAWDLYDPRERKLMDLIDDLDWQVIKRSSEMRNQLVHGTRVFKLDDCEKQATSLLAALDHVKTCFDTTYGYSGWATAKKRLKSQLHVDPTVQT